jgi:hypothetical protein
MVFLKRAQRKTECWIWPYSVDKGGYGHLQKNKKLTGAHKLIYEFINGKLPKGIVLDHLCRTPMCVNPTHLEAVSHAENCRRGNNTKISSDDVNEIKRLSVFMNHPEIAKKFGVSRQHISMIIRGKRCK